MSSFYEWIALHKEALGIAILIAVFAADNVRQLLTIVVVIMALVWCFS